MYPDLQRREIKTTTAVPEETTQKARNRNGFGLS